MLESFNTRTNTHSYLKISQNLKRLTFKINIYWKRKAWLLACHINRLFHNVKTGDLAYELVLYSENKSPNATIVDDRINYFIET